MENKLTTASESEDFDSQDFGDAEDVLSLCNLPIQGYQQDHLSPHSTTSSDPDLFEFFTGFNSDLSRNNSVLFSSGEIIDRVSEFRLLSLQFGVQQRVRIRKEEPVELSFVAVEEGEYHGEVAAADVYVRTGEV
ncbi:hypothetical protein ACSBR2_026692 [Camellia fascicularis]